MPTLVMMHGMTGTAEMMRPFAKSILPDGWDLLTPEASFSHPKRGFTWWRYEKEDEPRKRLLSSKELADVDASLHALSNQIPEGPLVLGGFSQGGAMAQELLHLPLASRVLGLICIATRCIRPLELQHTLEQLPSQKMLWMHGEKDARVTFDAGKEIVEVFNKSGWSVSSIAHSKGHMIPVEYHTKIRDWLHDLR